MITRRLFLAASVLLVGPPLHASELTIAPRGIVVLPGDWEPSAAQARQALDAIIAYLEQPVQQKRTRQDVDDVLGFKQGYRVQFRGRVVGEKKVIVGNFFPAAAANERDGFPNWRTQLVGVKDGGYSYWHITYDPATGSCTDFSVNGSG